MPPTKLSLVFLIIILFIGASAGGKPHVINFRWPNLYPEGMAWDPSAQHFIVGSLNHRSIHSVSDAGVVETLISDQNLPENVTVLGVAVDSAGNRLLACLHSVAPLPRFNALAAYDLRTGRRLFLSILPSDPDSPNPDRRDVANDVTVDFNGNAYVTNSAGNFIWKVDEDGEPSIFSKSPAFSRYPSTMDPNEPFNDCGLNGIAYVSKGYLLVVQSNTGKMFKVRADDGTARMVLLNKDLVMPDGVAMRKDGVVLVVSPTARKLWFLKSADSWAEGVVYDETALDEEGFPTSVVVGGEGRAYVLYGHVLEGIFGNGGREMFGIVEVRSEKENGEEHVWIFVLLGLGLAYFMFWRFQMGQLVRNMDKKIS